MKNNFSQITEIDHFDFIPTTWSKIITFNYNGKEYAVRYECIEQDTHYLTWLDEDGEDLENIPEELSHFDEQKLKSHLHNNSLGYN